MTIKLKYKKLDKNAITPYRAYDNGDCLDVFASEDIIIHSYCSTMVHTGLAFDIPNGYQLRLFNRSSNPIKKGLILSNSVGIIDSSYRGELCCLFHSLPEQADIHHSNGAMIPEYYLADNPVEIKKGDKIAQIKLVRIEEEELEEVTELSETTRGENGFGSSGNKFTITY